MTESVYRFIRTELRVIQTQCAYDNERFLNILADMIGKQADEIEKLKNEQTDYATRQASKNLGDGEY